MKTQIASIVLMSIAFSITPVAAEDVTYLVRIVEIDGTRSYSLMSSDEFGQNQALINAERKLFPKAIQMTLESWTVEGGSSPFPRNSIDVRSIAKIGTYNNSAMAQIKLAYCQKQEEKRRKAFEEMRNDSQKGGGGKQGEAWSKEKADVIKKARAVFTGILASLVAQDEAQRAASDATAENQ